MSVQWHVMSRIKGKKKVDMHIPGSNEEGARARLADILFVSGPDAVREYWIAPVESVAAQPKPRRRKKV